MQDLVLQFVSEQRKGDLPDMRKKIEKIVGLTLCMGLLTGCAQTPDSSLVKQKGSKAIESYTEAEITPVASAATTTIRDLINAPQTYKSQVTDDSAKLTVNTDATVEIPEVEKLSAISVTPLDVNQEFLDKITDAFFSDAKIYTHDSFYTETKSDIQTKIDELKEDVANGNLDPYAWGLDDNGDYAYDIYDEIEYLEQQYAEAPETVTLVEARPEVASLSSSDGFRGIAEFEDGSQFYYKVSSWGPNPLEIVIRKTAEKGGSPRPSDSVWMEYSSGSSVQKPTEESIGISLNEAKKIVQEKVEEMGIPDLQYSGWNYAVLTNIGEDNNMGQLADGYMISYGRNINGVPVTVTMDAGGALEDMDSTMETWAYENLYFYVTKDGIDEMQYSNPYKMGETKTENLSLLPFSEIISIYEKMMVIQNADNMENENFRIYDIDRIVLGYARIYEPSTDAHTGLMVPVWDFFGTRKSEWEYDGETYSDTTDYPTWSYLTINAVDGSIISRSLGY